MTEHRIVNGNPVNLTAAQVTALDAERAARLASPERAADQARQKLAATDMPMIRVLEDLIDALKAKGVIADADLPQSARDKLAERAAERVKL